jgi:hypothetical protein
VADELEQPTGDSSENATGADNAPVVSLESAENAMADFITPLPPLIPAPAEKKRRGRPPLTEAERAARKANKTQSPKRKAKRERAIKAVAASLGMSAESDDKTAKPLEPSPLEAPVREVEQPKSDPALAAMCGLTIDLAARYVPPQYGGGALAQDEKQILGDVWAAALIPYLDGPSSAIGVAAITTIQIFAIRAAGAKTGEVLAPPAPPAPPADTRGAVAGERTTAAADAKPAPTAKGSDKGRATIGKEKVVKLPTHSGED